jgi:hypothetical protein
MVWGWHPRARLGRRHAPGDGMGQSRWPQWCGRSLVRSCNSGHNSDHESIVEVWYISTYVNQKQNGHCKTRLKLWHREPSSRGVPPAIVSRRRIFDFTNPMGVLFFDFYRKYGISLGHERNLAGSGAYAPCVVYGVGTLSTNSGHNARNFCNFGVSAFVQVTKQTK